MASTSVLKLVIDDKEYNASLKEARTGMQHLENALNSANKTFNQVDKSVVDYVRGIGQMEAQSKTAKGRIGEMTTAFVELSMQYNRMSDEIKSGDVGKALAESMQTLKQRTIEAKQELADLNSQLDSSKSGISSGGGGVGSLFSGLGDKMTGMMQVFGGNLLAQGVANLTSELVGSVQQSVELAKQGEGVRIAFERLNSPGLLDNLKEATHGTVSEVELMKQAIKFENFKLPVEDLATYLGFAQQKAKDTGESIDYLVNSIVTGLGRQSKQILDNLGISAAELTKRMDEGATMTQAVADIIREEMAKAGDYVETAADRAARATAKATDEAEAFGREAMPIAQEWEETWAVLKSGAMSFAQTLLGPVAKSLQTIRSLERGIDWDKITSSSSNINSPNFNFGGVNNSPQWLNNQTVHAPGGYVVVSDGNGNVLGQRHFDDLSGVDAWRAGLGRRSGGRRGGGRNTPVKTETPLPVGSVAALNKELSELRKQQDLATSTEGWEAQQQKIDELTTKIKILKGEISDPKKVQQGKGQSVLGIGIGQAELDNVQKQLNAMVPDGGVKIPAKIEINTQPLEDVTKKGKDVNKAFSAAAQAVSSVGDAFNAIEDPSAKAAGTVLQAIASIALGFAQAAAAKDTTASGWAWLGWLAAGTAALATTISTVHSLTNLSEGGFVPGNSYSGDNIYGGNAMVNSGELVLNRSQQNNLANALQGGPQGLDLRAVVSGEQIVLVANRSLKRRGKGELVTWK